MMPPVPLCQVVARARVAILEKKMQSSAFIYSVSPLVTGRAFARDRHSFYQIGSQIFSSKSYCLYIVVPIL